MFLIREVDKLLENIASPGNEKKRRGAERLRISLSDIERINVEDLQLANKIRYPYGISSNAILDEMFRATNIYELNRLIPREKQMTTDGLFASLMISSVMSKLTETRHHNYPYAKLIICDRISYDLLLKFQRVLFVSGKSELRNTLYRTPFDITAIFLLDDLIDSLDRENEPVYFMKYDATLKRYCATYNYHIVRRTIPFLKVSDLTIILHNKKNLELGNFDMNSSHEHQVLQLFGHYARTSQLLELKSITRLIGIPHSLYNNVLEIQPFSVSDSSESEEHKRLGFSKPSLSYLSSMAEALIQLAHRLSMDLVSISYRTNDAHNQTKMFTEFVSMSLSSSQASKVVRDIAAKVLVIDRFHNLRGALLHADRYGAFLEQEKQSETIGERSLQVRIGTVDELDEKLQLDQLTEVLSSVLKHSISLKPNGSFSSGQQKPVSPMGHQPALTMSSSQSICRHLDWVKSIYKRLGEGYLLIVRLESNLESIAQEIGSSKEPLTAEDQTMLVDRIQRAVSAFRQLIKVSSKSIGVSDMVRVACILSDVINLFIHQVKVGNQSSANQVVKLLGEIKSTCLRSKKLKKLLKPILDASEGESESSSKIITSLDLFDETSCSNCQYTSVLPLEKVVEKFCLSELGENDSYSTTSLVQDLNQRNLLRVKEIIILAFLGSLSPYELSRLKSLEKSLKKKQQPSNIIVLACDFLKPEEFLMSL